MITTIDPGHFHRTVNFKDNIVYSTVNDKNGKTVELKLSLMVQNGNSERRAAGAPDDEADPTRRPLIVWIPGGGWRGCDKNLMVAEMAFLAENGYAVASIYYRSVYEGAYPCQIIDVKSAIRFLRANADQYNIDPDHVGVIGRSAGGHLAADAAMNRDGFDVGENLDFSSKVQVACDMFGPVDINQLNIDTAAKFSRPNYRWSRLEETHGGMLLGGDDASGRMEELAYKASPVNYINSEMCPILIMHGDADGNVNINISKTFYKKIAEAGYEDRATLCILKNGGHGTREFFQPMTKKVILDFFNRTLR